MNYIENIYVCLAAPMLLALLFSPKESKKMIAFLFAGMTMCLLSSYISTFIAAARGMDPVTATIELTPLVEEIMKILPMLFYLLVFEPEKESVEKVMLMCVLGFATFENVCYLTQNGAASLTLLLIRGLGTGAMHIVCGLIAGFGFLYLWYVPWMKTVGTVAMLCLSTIYHALYNLFVSVDGVIAKIGYAGPIVLLVLGTIILRPVLKKFILKNR